MEDYEVATDEPGGIFEGADVPDAAPKQEHLPSASQLGPVRSAPAAYAPTEPPPVQGPSYDPSLLQGGYSYPGVAQYASPTPALPQEGAHMLGLSLLAIPAGSYAGYKLVGGVLGTLAGGLAGAAGVNLVRAVAYYREGSQDGRREAVASGFYAAAGFALAGYLWYKASSDKHVGASASTDSFAKSEYLVRRAGP